MIIFENNIFLPKLHKQDHIKLDENKYIHYQICTDNQNRRWFIAVTLENNGVVTILHSLSKIKESYGDIQGYIKILPTVILDREVNLSLDNEMKKDFSKLKVLLQNYQNALNEFENKYNI